MCRTSVAPEETAVRPSELLWTGISPRRLNSHPASATHGQVWHRDRATTRPRSGTPSRDTPSRFSNCRAPLDSAQSRTCMAHPVNVGNDDSLTAGSMPPFPRPAAPIRGPATTQPLERPPVRLQTAAPPRACAWASRPAPVPPFRVPPAWTNHRRGNEKSQHACTCWLFCLVRLAGFEPTTPWFVAKYSIQLSYSRMRKLAV